MANEIINPADTMGEPIPGAQAPASLSAPMNASPPTQFENPADTMGEPIPQAAPMVKADVQLNQLTVPVDSSYANRAKLSLQRDNHQAALLAQQRQAGDIGKGGTLLNIVTHPMLSTLSLFQPDLTKDQASDALQKGTEASKIGEINAQFDQMPEASLNPMNPKFSPLEWMGQTISNNVLNTAGLAIGAALATRGGLNIPQLAAAGLVGTGGSLVTGAIGKLVNKNFIKKPQNPNNPSDPFYSRQNQASLANLNEWRDAGGLIGGAIGGALMPRVFRQNHVAVDDIIEQAGPILGDILDTQTSQAAGLQKTAGGLNVSTAGLPKNAENFVPAQVMDLKGRVQGSLSNAQGQQDANILQNAVFRNEVPATTSEFALNATNQTAAQRQANSAETDNAFKDSLRTQYNTLQPYWGMLDDHGFTPEDSNIVNQTAMEVVNSLSDKNLIGTLYGNNALSMNYTTKGLAAHATEIANDGPEIIDSLLDSLSTTMNRDPTGVAGIAAKQAYDRLYPVVKDAKTNSIKAHLTSDEVMGSNALSENEADILASNIKGAYSGAGQSPTAFNGADGIALPAPDTYGIEAPAGYASNRKYYYGNFAPKPTDISGYQYTEYHDNITKNIKPVIDFGNKLINSSEQVKSVMDAPEYIKAFGGNVYGNGLDYAEQKAMLDSSLSNSSNKLQTTFSDGIKSGTVPQGLTAGDTQGLQRIVGYGSNNQKNIGSWVAQNPDASSILFKTNNAGLIERPKTYQEILDDLSTPNNIPSTAKQKALAYIKSQEDPGDYQALLINSSNRFTNQVASLMSNGKAEDAAKVVDLAGQYKDTFGTDADPILANAYHNLGLGTLNSSQDVRNAVAQKMKALVGDNPTEAKDFTNQIEKVKAQLMQQSLTKQQKISLAQVNLAKPFEIPKIVLDVFGKIISGYMPDRFGLSLSTKSMNKLIGDSLMSRANYNAAKAAIDAQAAKQKWQKLINITTGGQSAPQQ